MQKMPQALPKSVLAGALIVCLTLAASCAAAAPDSAAALKDPSKATETAPDTFQAEVKTTKGNFVIEVHRDWAPKGADRFYNLIRAGFYKDIAIFRVIKDFMMQFGIHGDPAVAAVWREAKITDDPVKESNKRGMISFAMAGPNTRTTQMFVNFKDNIQLDSMGFSPFGKVVSGMDVVDQIFPVGEGAPRGPGPDQGRTQSEGNAYLKKDFPKLDYIQSIAIKAEAKPAPKAKPARKSDK